MADWVRNLVSAYNEIMVEKRDRRVDGWLLMSSPWPTVAICLGYVYVVWSLGPRLMNDRKPFQLRSILVWYNLAQVLFSLWLFINLLRAGWWGKYSFRCQPVDYSDDPDAILILHACWWYYFSKFTEFIDTIFFVMRKKYEHVSVLHVVHHGVMPFSVWFGVKFTGGGHSSFFGLLNTLVHVVMYFYYMMAAMGPQYQKYLWWKKYLTTFQMVQFVLIVIHAFQLLFIDCNYPRAFVWWIGGHAVLFFALFRDFYKKAYNKKKHDAVKNGSISNGTASNGHANGVVKSHQNGVANGYKNGMTNGHHIYTNGTVPHSSDNGVITRARSKQNGPEH